MKRSKRCFGLQVLSESHLKKGSAGDISVASCSGYYEAFLSLKKCYEWEKYKENFKFTVPYLEVLI